MIDKVHQGALAVVKLAFALVAAVFALVTVAALGVLGWHAAFGGSLLRPAGIFLGALAATFVGYLLAEFDRFEYVAPPTKTVTTRTASTGNPRSRKTTKTTTTRTTGGTT